MDDQEMQFAPPEWRPPKQQNAVQGQEADNSPQPAYTPPVGARFIASQEGLNQ